MNQVFPDGTQFLFLLDTRRVIRFAKSGESLVSNGGKKKSTLKRKSKLCYTIKNTKYHTVPTFDKSLKQSLNRQHKIHIYAIYK
jgi:hypothetical protein